MSNITSKILLILGSGPRIGQATLSAFLAAGYRVATASRTSKSYDNVIAAGNKDSHVHLIVDLYDPDSVGPVFDQVVKLWGAPSVVLYNAGTHLPTPSGILTAPLKEFTRSLNILTVSPFAAASKALALNPNVTFVYTGNCTNVQPIPGFGIMAVGKSASAAWLQTAATEQGRTAKFYYVDQRLEDGSPAFMDVNGQAHADLFLSLVDKEQSDPLLVFKAPAPA